MAFHPGYAKVLLFGDTKKILTLLECISALSPENALSLYIDESQPVAETVYALLKDIVT